MVLPDMIRSIYVQNRSPHHTSFTPTPSNRQHFKTAVSFAIIWRTYATVALIHKVPKSHRCVESFACAYMHNVWCTIVGWVYVVYEVCICVCKGWGCARGQVSSSRMLIAWWYEVEFRVESPPRALRMMAARVETLSTSERACKLIELICI